jgi:hypothetical protein
MSLYEDLQDKLNNVHIYNSYFMADCPFHEWTSHTQSLMIHDDGKFKCLSCGKYGTIEYIAKFIGKQTYRPTRNSDMKSHILPQWRKWEEQYGDVTEIAKAGHRFLKLYPQFMGFFKHRQIDQYFEQGYFGYISGWNLFPVFDMNHHIVDIVVRAWKGKGETRYVLHPDSLRETPYLYCPDWSIIKSSQHIFIVYGIVDSWTIYSLGFPVITGTSGKSLSSSLLKSLNKYFTIIPDKYEEEDAYRLAGELGFRANVFRLKFPENSKDTDDIRVQYGSDYLKELLTPIGE